MKYYDVYECSADPSIYAAYNTSNHEKIISESASKARKIYKEKHIEAGFVRASFICNK